MNMPTVSSSIITMLLLLLPLHVSYADEAVYGWQLMSKQERIEHRNRMRTFKTEEEREAYRNEHHKRMQERAREKGLSLPDTPRQRGKGLGDPADSSGRGMGRGQRM